MAQGVYDTGIVDAKYASEFGASHGDVVSKRSGRIGGTMGQGSPAKFPGPRPQTKNRKRKR